MKPAILAGLIFWGTMARVLSELMTWSVEHTQQGLLWLCNGMWAVAAGMVAYAVYRWFRYERGQAHKEADHAGSLRSCYSCPCWRTPVRVRN